MKSKDRKKMMTVLKKLVIDTIWLFDGHWEDDLDDRLYEESPDCDDSECLDDENGEAIFTEKDTKKAVESLIRDGIVYRLNTEEIRGTRIMPILAKCPKCSNGNTHTSKPEAGIFDFWHGEEDEWQGTPRHCGCCGNEWIPKPEFAEKARLATKIFSEQMKRDGY